MGASNCMKNEDQFFKELFDRLQHVEQLSRKNANSLTDLKYPNGIRRAMDIISELREKYK